MEKRNFPHPTPLEKAVKGVVVTSSSRVTKSFCKRASSKNKLHKCGEHSSMDGGREYTFWRIEMLRGEIKDVIDVCWLELAPALPIELGGIQIAASSASSLPFLRSEI